MAVFYKVYQDKSKSGKRSGKWYARAQMVETDDIDALAEAIEEKCTVNAADVVAVVRALISEMTRSLQASHRVKLPGFGTFKLGIATSGADKQEDFSVAKNIKGVRILFRPDTKINRAQKTLTRAFVEGVKFRELSQDDAEASKQSSNGGSTNSGSNSGSSTSGGNTGGSTSGGSTSGEEEGGEHS